MKKMITIFAVLIMAGGLGACAPEVGSEKWCASMKEKPKGDWSSNEASEYAKNCVFK